MLKALKEVNPSFFERVSHVYNLEAAADRKLIYLFVPDGVRVKVRSNHDSSRADLSHLSELVFGREGLMLSPLLQVPEHELLILLNVVDQNGLLVGITVPVLRFILVVGSRVFSEGLSSFTDTGQSVVPGVVQFL